LVEGKVKEAFGPMLSGWRKEKSTGKDERWKFLKEKLGLHQEPPLTMRYQLFHRLASAIIEAEKFNSKYALMIVPSFSREDKGFADYAAFLDLFGAKASLGNLVPLPPIGNIAVYSGWVRGDPKYLSQ
jgi:hypothetical protein